MVQKGSSSFHMAPVAGFSSTPLRETAVSRVQCKCLVRFLVAYQFPCDYAGLGFSPYAILWRQCAASTSYLTVVGNNCSSRASLHPDHQLPKDLWWAHSPGCPPPIKNLGRRSARPVEGNQSLGPRKET